MTDVPYIPHQEGPLYPDDSGSLADEATTFLRASNRDIDEAVARQNIADMAESSRKLWVAEQLAQMGINPEKPHQ